MSAGWDHASHGQRIIGVEENGADPRWLTTRQDALGPEEWQLPEPSGSLGHQALDTLVGGPAPVTTREKAADIWNAGQVLIGTVPVKIADADSGRTTLRIRNTDPATMGTVWLGNNTAVNTGGTGSISMPASHSYTMTHTSEVWAVSATGPVMLNVEVERSN